MATLPANTYSLKLSFSTWACPEWTVAAIVDGMQTYGYQGVELRLGKGHLHGVDLDSQTAYLADVRKQFDDSRLAVSCLATSFAFNSPDLAERRKALDGVKQALRVAELLGAPYVRVLGGDFPAHHEVTGCVDAAAEMLAEAGEFAEKERCRSMVLLETQGAFSHSKYISELMRQVYHPKVGVLWDVIHPLRRLEKAEETYDEIGPQVRHLHVHDFVFNADSTQLAPCPPGEGIVPLGRIVDMLKAGRYRGYLSVELHQQKNDPDLSLPPYASFLKGLLVRKEQP